VCMYACVCIYIDFVNWQNVLMDTSRECVRARECVYSPTYVTICRLR